MLQYIHQNTCPPARSREVKPSPGPREQQQCCSKFSSNAGKVQRLPWQAGKNIGKMNCEHGNCSSLFCSKRPGHFELGLVEHGGGGFVVCTGGDKVGRVICCQLKRQQGSWTSCFLKKRSVFPPEGQDAVGPSLSCKGMALTNQPPSVFSSAAAWHVKQQLIESLVRFGFTSVAALLLCVLFVILGSTHCFSASYGLIQRHRQSRIPHRLLFLNSQSEIGTLNRKFLTRTFDLNIVLTLIPNLKGE